MPIKESEHVYILFEDVERRHGLWLTRIPEDNSYNNLNFSPGSKRYEENIEGTKKGIEGAVVDVPGQVSVPELSEEFVVEDSPHFNARIGDRVIHGSNNTIIILGRDRVDGVDSGKEDAAGSVDIVSGREGEDIDYKKDKSRVLVTSNSEVDDNFGIEDGNKSSGGPAVVIKSDEIRIIAGKDMKLVVDGEILIGKGANQSVILGEELKTFLATPGSVATPAGPGSITLPDNVFSKNVKVKK